MEQTLKTIQEFLPFIRLIVTGIIGTVGGWFLKTLDYNRDKKKRQAHLKAKLLDEILDQCRKLEANLSNYPELLKKIRKILNAEEIDHETGIPTNFLNIQKKDAYEKYIKGIEAEKNRLRHVHQNYIIKTKSGELKTLNTIDESLTKLINYDDSPDFDFAAATMEYMEVYTNLRLIHHQIKEVYPEEVPFD